MNITTKRVFAIAGVLALGLSAVKAQTDSALLDALVKKGVLSDKEAEDIRTTDAKDYNTTAASKFSIGSYIQKITFYGDGRLRYDVLAQNNFNSNSKNVQDRFRYRLRLGADYNYSDNLKAGVELESSTTDDSGNQTFGATFTKASINVGKVYAQWAPTDWLTLDAGKFSNPWYTTTDMTYSLDENPEGAAELLSFNFPLGGGSGGTAVDPKDLKQVQTIASQDSSITVGLNAVQYLYVTSNQSTATNGSGLIVNNNNVGIIGNQIPITWKIDKDVTVKVVPGFTFYTGGGNTDYQGGVPANYTNGSGGVGAPAPVYYYGTANSSSDPVFYSPKEADYLNIVSVPGEVDFKIADIPVRPYWDFDWNVTGKQRVQDVFLAGGSTYGVPQTGTISGAGTTATIAPGTVGYGSDPTIGKGAGVASTATAVRAANSALGDNVAWAVGVQVGQNKKKGDASGLVEFRQIGLGSVDTNINGTDFANSYSNVEGLKFSAAYNFTDAFLGTVTFYDDWAYKNNLYQSLGGGTATAPVAGTTQYLVSAKNVERVQVDLGWKF